MNRDYSSIEDLPYRIQPIYLEGKGVLRKGFPIYCKDAWAEGKQIGYVTSGTMIPYYKTEGQGLERRLHRRDRQALHRPCLHGQPHLPGLRH